VLLGRGHPVVGDLGIDTLARAARLDVVDATVLPGRGGPDPSDATNVRLVMTPRRVQDAADGTSRKDH
jgi:hypothetical protein